MSRFDGDVEFRIGNRGPCVLLRVENGANRSDIIVETALFPAQARELAMVLLGEADRVEQREGIPGEAHRGVRVSLPAIEFNLPARGQA